MQPRCAIDAAMLPAPSSYHGPVEPCPVAASWKACHHGGSTGTPKVIVDGRPAGFPAGTAFIGIPADGRVLVPGPLYHRRAFQRGAVLALWNGCAVHPMDRPLRCSLPRFEEIAQEGICWALMVPTMMHRGSWPCLKPRGHLRLPMPLVEAGCAHRRPMAPRLGSRRGSTGSARIMSGKSTALPRVLCRCWIGGRRWLEPARPGSVGRPIGGARILHPELRWPGHARHPGTSRARSLPCLPAVPDRLTATSGPTRVRPPRAGKSVGDIGWLDAAGYLYLADRKECLDRPAAACSVLGPPEVEAAILRHPDVRSCAVFGKPDPDLGARVHAVIETNSALSAGDLSAFLADHLAKAKHPAL